MNKTRCSKLVGGSWVPNDNGHICGKKLRSKVTIVIPQRIGSPETDIQYFCNYHMNLLKQQCKREGWGYSEEKIK